MTIKITSRNFLLIAVLATSIGLSHSASATIYKWRDARGKVQYSDKPPTTDATLASPAEIVNALQSKELCIKPESKVSLNKTQKNQTSSSENFFGISGLAKPTSSSGTTSSASTSAMASVANSMSSVKAPTATTTPITMSAKSATSLPASTATAPAKLATTPAATTPAATTPAATTPAATTPAATTPAATTPAATTPAAQSDKFTSSNLLKVGLMPAVDLNKQPAPAIGYSTIRIIKTTIAKDGPRPPPAGGEFRLVCKYSHMSNDDPLVYPNQQGAAHHHTFFGNTSVNFKSNLDALSTTGTSTCAGGVMNRTGYWVPSMIDTATNTPLTPEAIVVYYKTASPSYVQVPPAKLRMIAGNSKATSKQNGTGGVVTRVDCLGGVITSSDGIVKCGTGTTTLSTFVTFPQCWDGKNLDSPDHKSHMAYRGVEAPILANGCSAAHPVLIPDIAYNVHYHVNPGVDTSKWRLASDNYPTTSPGGYSLHGDWVNGWDPKYIKIIVDNCLRTRSDCHGYLLGDGTISY